MSQENSKKDPLLMTKIVGTLCVAGLVFLFGRWGAETLTSRGAHDDGHGAEGDHAEVTQAYTVEVADAGGDDHGGATVDINSFMQNADPAKGEKVFGKCKACHALEPGKNGTGPSLAGIFGRKAGTEPGFAYSDAMVEYGQDWNVENLFAFLGDVKGTVPGTKMSFAGIKKEDQRADLIAFLMGDQFSAADFAGSETAAAEESEQPTEAEATQSDTGGEAVQEDAVVVASAGDAEKGAKIFNKCKACHKVEPGANGVGPTLFAVFDRPIGSVEGFSYSPAMAEHGGVWDAATLDAFLSDVKGTIPGTKMSFAGIKKDDQRADLIAYLETLK